MIIATHEMAFAQEVADKVCFLDAGVILRGRAAGRASSRRRASRAPREFLRRVLEAGRI